MRNRSKKEKKLPMHGFLSQMNYTQRTRYCNGTPKASILMTHPHYLAPFHDHRGSSPLPPTETSSLVLLTAEFG